MRRPRIRRQRQYKYKLELVNHNDNPQDIYTRVLRFIHSNLHDYVRSAHASIVKSLILKTNEKIDLSNIEFDSANFTEKEKVNRLFEAVYAQGKLHTCQEAPKDFLEIIINFNFKSSLAQEIRAKIESDFNKEVKIVKEEHLQLLSPDRRSNTIFCYLNCFLMACLLILFGLIVVNVGGGQILPFPSQNSNSTSVPEILFNSTPSPSKNESSLNEPEVRSIGSEAFTDATDDEVSNATTIDTTSIFVNATSPVPKLVKRKRPKFKVKVNSHDVYKDLMPFAPADREIIAGIFVEDPTKWPCNINLTSAHRIERLYIGGDIYVSCLLHGLNQTTKLSFLLLSNRFGKLCRWNEGLGASLLSSEHSPVYLNQTTRLVLERFSSRSSCADVYLAVAEKIKTPNLKGFALKKGVVDDRNIVLIQRILKNNWKTLTHLKFQWTHTTAITPFFGSEMAGVLKHVEHVSIDYISDYVSWRFCQALPNLKALTSRVGYLLESQLPQLQDCYSLETLETSLKLTKSMLFDARVFSSGFPNITTINLTLVHDSCQEDPANANILYLRGLNTLKENLRYFTVVSKCRLIIDPESGPLSNPHRQESRSRSSRGHFSFSYDLKKDFQDE